MDKRNQDQAVGLMYIQEVQGDYYGLTLWDRPDIPIQVMLDRYAEIQGMPDGEAKKAAMAAWRKEHGEKTRLRVGRDPNGAHVEMMDSTGRCRIRLSVGDDDIPSIEILDSSGHIVWSATTRDGSDDVE